MAKGKSLSKMDMIEMAVTIYEHLLEGKSDSEIMEDMRLDAESFAEIRKFMIEGRATNYRSTTREHMFVEYVIEQRGVIKDIQKRLDDVGDSKQLGAVSSLLRLKSDIIDRIIAKGQEFGVFKKSAERKEIVAGILHGDLSNEELLKLIAKQSGKLISFARRFGDGDILALPEKPTHYGDSGFIETTGESDDEDDDEEDLPPPKDKKSSKRVAGRSGKHTGHRERRDSDADE